MRREIISTSSKAERPAYFVMDAQRGWENILDARFTFARLDSIAQEVLIYILCIGLGVRFKSRECEFKD